MDSLQMTGVAGPVEKSAIWFGTALRKRPPTTTKRPEKTTKTMQLKGKFLHFPNKCLVQLIEPPILQIPNFNFPNLRFCKVFF